MHTCKNCQKSFEISQEDQNFYSKMSVPPPTFCPDCRLQRRLVWRNERSLNKRKCDLCDKLMISVFSQESQYKVFCQKCWWSDSWDPYKYARDFDFNRPFFEQFAELLKDVPVYGLINEPSSLENSDYVNYTKDAKNCYLCFAANYLEDCMYSSYLWESRDSLDCSYSTNLELCYECIDCDKLYNCSYLQNSRSCTDCNLGFELRNCRDCFGCVNISNKQYYFFNKQLSKEEYEQKLSLVTSSPEEFKRAQSTFEGLILSAPRKFANKINCENAQGDCLKDCRNTYSCFDGYGGEDLKWVINFPGATKDCYDIYGCAKLELAVDTTTCAPGYNIKYCNSLLNGGTNIEYSSFTNSGSDLFGCVGTKMAKHCILNKQYNEADYHNLRLKIIDYMKKTGEYGEFFPISISPFAYNESLANDYFPLTKTEAIEKGFKWRSESY